MAYKFLLSAFLIIIVAQILNPQLASDSRQGGSMVAAPPYFVREKLLSPDFIHEVHESGKDDSIKALRLIPGSKILKPALEAKPGDRILLTTWNETNTTAKVMSNDERSFVWRIDRSWGQRVYHNLTFEDLDTDIWRWYPDGSTQLWYTKTWKGSALLFHLRHNFPQLSWLFGTPETGGDGWGPETVHAIQEAWEDAIGVAKREDQYFETSLMGRWGEKNAQAEKRLREPREDDGLGDEVEIKVLRRWEDDGEGGLKEVPVEGELVRRRGEVKAVHE